MLKSSDADKTMTKLIYSAGEMLGIPLVDHLIIGKSSYVSLQERGLIEGSY